MRAFTIVTLRRGTSTSIKEQCITVKRPDEADDLIKLSESCSCDENVD